MRCDGGHTELVEGAGSGHRAPTPGLGSSLGGGGALPASPPAPLPPDLPAAILLSPRARPAPSSCLLIPPESYFYKCWLPGGPVFLPQAGWEEAKNNSA